jgi:hypothetical protein
MVRLVGKDVTGAFKAKAQSGALFKSRGYGCAFFCWKGVIPRQKFFEVRS